MLQSVRTIYIRDVLLLFHVPLERSHINASSNDQYIHIWNWTLPLFIPRQHYHIFSFKVLTLPNLGGLFVKESPAAGGSCRSLLGGLQRHRPIHRRFHERAYRHLMWRHKASLDDVIARHRSCTERCKYPRLCDGSILLNDVREEYRILTGTINYFMIIINLLECRIVFILS